MKVIIPVIDNTKAKNKIASGFHNAEYVCIHDYSTHSSEWVATKTIIRHMGNLSIELKQREIYTVISPFVSLMTLRLFIESGLKVYRSNGDSVPENIQLLLENQLEEFTVQSALGIAACIGSCDSCNTTCN